ncbi:hypothetical protein [Pedobacter sp. NJ-S-72]
MAKTIAYITDTHLGQKIILEEGIKGGARNIRYDNDIAENAENKTQFDFDS